MGGGGHVCFVPGCINKSTQNQNLSFFGFPHDNVRCIDWCQTLGIAANQAENANVALELRNKRICSSHFSPTQYSVKLTLANNAAPTANMPFGRDIQPRVHQENRPPVPPNTDRERISHLKALVRKLQDRETSLEKQLLKAQNKSITSADVHQYFVNSKSLNHIIAMQVERYGKRNNCNYTDIERTMALTLYYSCGHKGYSTLIHLGFRLPSTSTIRRWICKLDLRPGRNQIILDCLAEKVLKMVDKEKDCILSLDETSLTKLLTYNKFKDELEGIEDFGNNERAMTLADNVLVLMVHGINTPHRTTLSYYFSTSSTTSDRLTRIVLEAVEDLGKIGMKVRAVLTDQGGCNQGMYKRLGADEEKPFFILGAQKVYCLYDAPHIMKNIRNNLLKHNYVIEGEEGEVNWNYIKDFYDLDTSTSIRTCPKLTTDHIEPSNWIRMKVKLATQVFSHSVHAGMTEKIAKGELSETARMTANFCGRMDKIFDMLNISSEFCPLKKWKSGQNVFKDKDKYLVQLNWVSKITKTGPNEYVPCLHGLQQTLRGMHMIISDLELEGYKYVLTRRFQTDSLEHFFALIKHRMGAATKPTCTDFRLAFRYAFITNLMKSPEGSNCEAFAIEERDLVADTMCKIEFLLKRCRTTISNDNVVQDELPENISDSDDEFESGGEDSNDEERISFEGNSLFKGLQDLEATSSSQSAAVYMAGWAIKKCLKKSKCRNSCPDLLQFSSDRDVPGLDREDEYFTYMKAYDTAIFDKNLDKSFGELVTESSKPAFKSLGECIAKITFESQNLHATQVMRNITRNMCRDVAVGEWFNDETIPPECQQHRKSIVTLMCRARLYVFIQEIMDGLKLTFKKIRPFTKESGQHYDGDETATS